MIKMSKWSLNTSVFVWVCESRAHSRPLRLCTLGTANEFFHIIFIVWFDPFHYVVYDCVPMSRHTHTHMPVWLWGRASTHVLYFHNFPVCLCYMSVQFLHCRRRCSVQSVLLSVEDRQSLIFGPMLADRSVFTAKYYSQNTIPPE